MRCAAGIRLCVATAALLACAGNVDSDEPRSAESGDEAWERLHQSGQRWGRTNTDASALYHERAWRLAREFPPPDVRLVRSELAFGEARRRQGRMTDAEQLLRSAARHARGLEPEDPALLASVLQSLGLLEVMGGDLEAAEAAFLESARLHAERLDPRSADAAENIVQLAETQRRLGQLDAAEENLFEAAEIYLDLGPQYAIRIATIENNLGLLYQELERYADAQRLHRQAILRARQENNEHNPNTAIYSRGLGDLYVRVGELEGAEELYRYALGVLEETVGSDNLETRLTRERLEDVSAQLGRPEAPGEETFR